ncbi:MAG TPA: hypothetical protein VF581_08345 [Flavobacterium sp.]|jgi:hypothetical protein
MTNNYNSQSNLKVDLKSSFLKIVTGRNSLGKSCLSITNLAPLILLFVTATLCAQCPTPPGNPATYPTGSWNGYVYTGMDAASPPANAFVTYTGYLTEAEIFDRNYTTTAVSAATLCGTYADNYAIRYRMIKNCAPGYYTFTIGGDDGYRLSVDGGTTFLIANYADHNYLTTTSAPVFLNGSKNFVLEYYERVGDSRVSFSYTFCATSTAPTSITGTSTTCSGTAVTLTANGGIAAAGVTYEWGTGTVVGTNPIAGNGVSVSVSPTANTTYWVRRKDNSACSTAYTTGVIYAVAVKTQSVPPTSITGTTTICQGDSTVLTATGGTLSAGSVYQWGTGIVGSGIIAGQTSALITVAPTATTTYWVRNINAPCAPTSAVTQAVTVNVPPGNPATYGTGAWLGYVYTGMDAANPPTNPFGTYRGNLSESESFDRNYASTTAVSGSNICGSYLDNYAIRYRMAKNCAPGYYTFTVGGDDGYRLSIDGGATFLISNWLDHTYATSGSTPVFLSGNVNFVLEYFERTNDSRVSFGYSFCATSTAPTSISGATTICSGSSTTLTANGGIAAPGVTYEWGTGTVAGTNPITGTGASITVTPTSDTTYWVRRLDNSACSTSYTSGTTALVTVQPLATAPSSITGTTTICLSDSTVLTATGGVLPTGAAYQWGTGTVGSNIIAGQTAATITVAPTTATTYWVRIINGSCAPTTSATATVTVNVPAGDQTSYAVDAWVGYVYTSIPTSPPANNFSANYKGFIKQPANFDYDLGAGNISSPTVCGTPGENFAIRFKRQSNLPAGYYTFTVGGDDGYRLSIDGGATWIVSNWSTHTYTSTTSAVYNLSGNINFVLEYYEWNGLSRVSFNATYCTQSTAPTLISGTASTCAPSGNIVLTASGGTAGNTSTYQWGTGNVVGTNPIAGTTASITVNPGSTTTTYWVRRVDGGICSQNTSGVTHTITVSTPSTGPTSISGTTVICQGSSTTLTAVGGTLAGGGNYEWGTGTVGTNILVGQNAASLTVSPTATTTYWVRAIDVTPCTAPTAAASATVTVKNAATAPTSITGTLTLCQGNSTTLTATGGTLTTGAVYEWGVGFPGLGIIAGQTGPSITVTPSATTTYWVRITNAPCPATAAISETVTVNVPAGDQVSYNINSWIGYVYSPIASAPPPDGFSTNYRGYVTQPRIFDYDMSTGNVSGPSLCGTYAENFAIRFKMRANQAAGYYTFTVGGDDGYRLSIDGGATWFLSNWGLHSYTTTTSAVVYLSGSTDFIIEYYEQNGFARVSFNMTYCSPSTAPTAISAPASVCSPSGNIVLTATGGTMGNNATYQWGTGTVAGSNILTTTAGPTLTVNPGATTTTYWVRIIDGGNCNLTTSAVYQTVNVISPSTAPTLISGIIAICQGNSTTLTASGGTLATGATYQWGTGTVGSNIIAGATTDVITVSPSTTTSYWVRRLDLAPCTTPTAGISATVTVTTLSTAPTFIIGANLICQGSSTTLTAAGATLGSNATFEWGTGSTVGTGTIIGTTASITVSPASTTTYWARVRDGGTCNTVTTGVTFVVNVSAPSTAPTGISGNLTICNSDSTTLTATGGTLSTGSTYEWGTGTVVGSNIISGATAASITVSPTATTSYWVRRLSPSPCAPTTGISVQVNVNTPPGDQITSGANSWIAYIYAPIASSPPPDNFSANYRGYYGIPEVFDYDIGTASINGPNMCGTYNNNVAVRFKMIRNYPAGYYTFTVGGDDGYRLSIDGGATWLISNWSQHLYQTTTSAIVYLSGNTNMVMEYYDWDNLARASFNYSYCRPSTAPTSITAPATVCSPSGNIVLTAAGGTVGTNVTYQWGTGTTEGANILATTTSATYTVNPGAVTTTYWVRRIDGGLCNLTTSAAFHTITVNAPSTAPTTITGTTAICQGSSTTLVASGGSAASGSVYQWGTGTTGSNIIAGETTDTIIVSPTANTTYWVRRIDLSPCSTPTAAKTVLITVTTTSTAPTSVTGIDTICKGTSTTLTANGAVLGTSATYQWGTGTTAGSGIITGTAASLSVTPTVTTTYWVRVKVLGACNSFTSAVFITVNVNVPSTAPTTITGNTTVCEGSSTTLTASGGTHSPGATYEWGTGTWGTNILAGENGATLTITPSVANSYWVRRIDVAPCTTPTPALSFNIFITTNSTAPTEITGASVICRNSSTTLTAVGAVLGTSATYQWGTGTVAGSNLMGSTVATNVVNPLITTTYWVRVKVAGGCNYFTDAVFYTLNVMTPSTAPTTISGTTTICSGGTTTLTASGGTPAAGAVYEWGTGTVGDNIIAGETAAAITVSPSVTTTYWVRRIDLDPCNTPTSAKTVTVTISSPSTAPDAILGTDLICKGTGTLLTASGGVAGSNVIYQWGTGTVAGTGIITGTTISRTVAPVVTTTYWVRRIDTPCNVPTEAAFITITVNNPSTAIGSITGPTSVCAGSSITLSAISGTLGTNAVYEWGTDAAGTNIIAGATASTLVVSPTVATTYWVRRVDPAPCSTVTAAKTVTISVAMPSVAPQSISGANVICKGSSTTLSAIGGQLGTSATYQWGTGATVGAGTIIGTTSDLTVTPAATTTYWVRIKDNGACSAATTGVTFTINVSIPSTSPTTISAPPTICPGGTVTLTASGGTLGTDGSYEWGTGFTGLGILAGQTAASITVNPAVTTTYWVRRIDQSPCNTNTSALTVTVTVRTLSTAPTSISSTNPIPFCNGTGGTTLNAIGEALGSNGAYQWGTGTVGSNIIAGQTASTLSVNPTTSTTYWVRCIDAICGNTTAGVTLDVTLAPSTIAGTLSTLTSVICRNTLPGAITISGHSGVIVKWQKASNAAFTAGVTDIASTSTTLIPSLIGALSATTYFRAVVQNGSCSIQNTAPIQITVPAAVIYSGSWSATPNATTPIIVNSNFTLPSNMHVCACAINGSAVVTIPSGMTLTVEKEIIVASTANIIVENNGSVVQVDDASINTGAISVKRSTTPMKLQDYTYWSAPVQGNTLNQLSPATLYDKYFSFNPLINNWVILNNGTPAMQPAKGYIVRAPQGWSLTNATSGIYHAAFRGVPNNGVVSATIEKGAGTYNLIGNPYPSAIDIDLFLLDPANENIVNGTVYLWTHNTAISTSIPGNSIYNYTMNDYAKYNLTGGVKTASAAISGGVEPTGKIASGQAFFIEANSALANGSYTATFNNSMRIINNNNQFFRPSANAVSTVSTIEKHRVWLHISNTGGAYDEMLLGYVQGATNEIDTRYDGAVFPAGNVVGLYSIQSDQKFSIQGRALPFNQNDIIPMGYTTTIAGSFSLGLENFDGLFDSQLVYLVDKLDNSYHNLKLSDYTFTTAAGTFDNRFELRFLSTALATNENVASGNEIIVIKKDRHISINAGLQTIQSLTIFDITGKRIYTESNINSNVFTTVDLQVATQVLVLKIKFDDGTVVSKKVIMN